MNEQDLSGLTARQRRYVDGILSGLDGTAAARKAGYSGASTAAYRLNRHPLVRAAIEGRLKELKISADVALAQDSEIAKAPWQDYATTDKHGRVVIDYKALIADGYGFCIRGIRETKWGQVVELEDAAAARERLMRHHGLFNDKLRVSMDEFDGVSDEELNEIRLAAGVGTGSAGGAGASAAEA